MTCAGACMICFWLLLGCGCWRARCTQLPGKPPILLLHARSLTCLSLFALAIPAALAQEGPLAFYKGWLPSVIGVIPYVGLNFGVYETLKHMLLLHYGLRDERELSVPSRLACGAAAGTMGQTVAYPFDVARRRLQVGCNWPGHWGLGFYQPASMACLGWWG